MRVDFMRDDRKEFPKEDDVENCTHLRVWHCKFKSLKPIALFSNIEELVIGTFPDSNFEFLCDLKKLKYLRVLHFPKIKTLDGLEFLSKLQILSLATNPSWDASGKVQTVNSLEPIGKLRHLKHVELLGVVSKDKSLNGLEKCKNLKSARISKYPPAEIARFRALTKIADAFNPNSTFDSSLKS